MDKKNDEITITITKDGNLQKIKEELYRMKAKFKRNIENSEIVYTSDKESKKYFNLKNAENDILFWGNGQIGFNNKGRFLLEYFDKVFRNIALKWNAREKAYPVLLPIDAYTMTGYLKKTPQYALFCSTVQDEMTVLEQTNDAVESKRILEIINEPIYALSPSACFHTYLEYRNKVLDENTVITFRQNVFRNEGRLNYEEIGRLCDYQVREIVMIGSDKFVTEVRDSVINEIVFLMKELKLQGDIGISSDSFVVPKMQMYKKMQRIDKSKYELHLKVERNQSISAASFNLHGKAFTDPFHIEVLNCDETVTACVGFGLQRWVIAFFAQYGFDDDKWPVCVQQAYRNEN